MVGTAKAPPKQPAKGNAFSPKRVFKKPSAKESPGYDSYSSRKPKNNPIYVAELKSGVYVAFARNKAYVEHFPAFVRDIASKFNANESLMEDARIDMMCTRVDDQNIFLNKQYGKHDKYGKLTDDFEEEVVFVHCLKDDQKNNEKRRQLWGENLAQIFSRLSDFGKKFEFGGDKTGDEMKFLCEYVNQRDTLYVGQYMNSGADLDDVIKDDSIMKGLFKDAAMIRVIRKHYLENVGSTDAESGASNNLLDGLNLHRL